MLTTPPAPPSYAQMPWTGVTVPMRYMSGGITLSSQVLRASDLNTNFDRILAAKPTPAEIDAWTLP